MFVAPNTQHFTDVEICTLYILYVNVTIIYSKVEKEVVVYVRDEKHRFNIMVIMMMMMLSCVLCSSEFQTISD